MSSFKLIALIFTCVLTSVDAEVGKSLNPNIPGSEWRVHDLKRPKPKRVEPAAEISHPAPSDAVVLLGKKSASGWENASWKLVDGVMTVGKGDNRTKESFRDFQLNLEWRIPADRRVKGQIGGNSGIFLMGLYEVQIQASHLNETYADGQAAALYGQFPPLVNASVPKGQWNHYQILFRAPRYQGKKCVAPARVTVFHNGVLVHHGREFMGPTRHRRVARYPEQHPERGPIRLQDHGDPIQFRNIWVRHLPEAD